jgi:DNA-directed RNA polymerase subunit H (RpoH/RPB5)
MLKKTKEKFEDDGYKIVVKDSDLIGTTQDEKIIVRVATGEKSIGVSVIRTLLKIAEKEEVTETHLVSDAPLTPQAKKMVAEHGIRYLSMKNVLIDILQHDLVPKHTILSTEEKEDLFNELKIEASQLPKVRRTDPIIKLLNGKPGDVVRIQRQSPTAGVSIYYRLIVAA